MASPAEQTAAAADAPPSLPAEHAHAVDKAAAEREASSPLPHASDVTEKEQQDAPTTETDKEGKETDDKAGAKEDAKEASPPPLPDEPVPDVQEDDGWDPMWSEEHEAWFFYNRFTQKTQWENPRVPDASASASKGMTEPPPGSVAGGYNPAIHGDYDPNAWYAKGTTAGVGVAGLGSDDTEDSEAAIAAAVAAANAALKGPQSTEYRYSGEAKARRQMNAYFDVDAAASEHDGRSLKAERSGKKPTRAELKAFKEKRRARKEEKRRAWLRD